MTMVDKLYVGGWVEKLEAGPSVDDDDDSSIEEASTKRRNRVQGGTEFLINL